MNKQPWASGPGEILKHALYLLENDSDVNRRLAMISIDNSVELMIKTYLGLPKRITGLEITRKEYAQISNSFPDLLDGLENFGADALIGISLGEIEWFHRLRNELYHQGNGLTVEREKVEKYADLAKLLFKNLYKIELPEYLHPTLLYEFLESWMHLLQEINAIHMQIYLLVGPEKVQPPPVNSIDVLENFKLINQYKAGRLKEIQQLRENIFQKDGNYKKYLSKELIGEIITNRSDFEMIHTEVTRNYGDISPRIPEMRIELDNLLSEQPRLLEQMNKLRERVDRLYSYEKSECPLCGQELTEEHKELVLIELQHEGKELADRFRGNKQRIKELQLQLDAWSFESV